MLLVFYNNASFKRCQKVQNSFHESTFPGTVFSYDTEIIPAVYGKVKSLKDRFAVIPDGKVVTC
jgi:hypothetical protein